MQRVRKNTSADTTPDTAVSSHLKTKESILEFWENKKLTMPELYKLSKIILAAPATQVSVERLFSALKFILSLLRSNLSKELVNDILVVRCNHF
ncbi:hypothetical protein ALC60_13794 [Trachymyrmex zeteki]|uniref:HAT C-terminal dimerisation domain-containing protein n=1 Tax=Mycetomoellerius zeteki TaxID=64791 RepID=A0A151WH63_9HYME|nr:hypothetical protein ALC60_13794 [Trachymyrmex zeteki]